MPGKAPDYLRRMDYTHPQRGYPRLAALMGKEKDIAIFRRFDDLNILSLLSLQAEIVQLEKEFQIECAADELGGRQPALQFSSNFQLSRESHSEQTRRLQAIKSLVKEYSTFREGMDERISSWI